MQSVQVHHWRFWRISARSRMRVISTSQSRTSGQITQQRMISSLTRRNIKKILSVNVLIIKREARNINLFLFFCTPYFCTPYYPLATPVLRPPRGGVFDFLVYFLIIARILLYIKNIVIILLQNKKKCIFATHKEPLRTMRYER